MSSTQIESDKARLEVRELHLWRGERHLLRGVSFTLHAGELLQVVGPNGVGKTTLLRCAAGLLPPESGDVYWCDKSLASDRDTCHQQFAYLAHVNALKAELTALENLHFGVGIRRQVATSVLRDTLERLQVGHCADLPVRSLSAGQRRRVALARVFLTQAPLWILDEPVTNLDTAGIELFERSMAQHLADGGMILTAAHLLLLKGQPGVRTLELH